MRVFCVFKLWEWESKMHVPTSRKSDPIHFQVRPIFTSFTFELLLCMYLINIRVGLHGQSLAETTKNVYIWLHIWIRIVWLNSVVTFQRNQTVEKSGTKKIGSLHKRRVWCCSFAMIQSNFRKSLSSCDCSCWLCEPQFILFCCRLLSEPHLNQ